MARVSRTVTIAAVAVLLLGPFGNVRGRDRGTLSAEVSKGLRGVPS